MHLLSTCILFITSTLLFNDSVQALPTTESTTPLIRAPLIRRTDLVTSILEQQKINKRDPFQSNLYNYQASTYLINLAIGTPLQNFTVSVDTGSSDLWVPGNGCPTSSCPSSLFDSSKSSTFQNLNQAFNIQYGSGSANGTYGQDTVTIGNVQVTNQQFGLATTAQGIFDTTTTTVGGGGSSSPSTSNDNPTPNGILGLGYPLLTASTSTRNTYNPVVFNMVQEKLIANPIFSIYMNTETSQGWAGEIIFGGVDQTKYTGNLVYVPNVPIVSAGSSGSQYSYWMVYAQGIALKGSAKDMTQSFASGGSTKTAFILDTGTTLTYLPSTIVESIITGITSSYSYNSNSQVYEIDCNLTSSNATIELQISQSSSSSSNPVTITVPVANLVYPFGTLGGVQVCYFGIAPSGTSGSVNIGSSTYLVGDSILRQVYTVFDIGQNRIGLAAASGVGGSVNGVSGGTSTSQAIITYPNMLSLKLIAVTALLFSFFG